MSERDPLMNPAIGDVVEKTTSGGRTIRRTVRRVLGLEIRYVSGDGGRPLREGECFISTWREWCVKATVVEKAQG